MKFIAHEAVRQSEILQTLTCLFVKHQKLKEEHDWVKIEKDDRFPYISVTEEIKQMICGLPNSRWISASFRNCHKSWKRRRQSA